MRKNLLVYAQPDVQSVPGLPAVDVAVDTPDEAKVCKRHNLFLVTASECVLSSGSSAVKDFWTMASTHETTHSTQKK